MRNKVVCYCIVLLAGSFLHAQGLRPEESLLRMKPAEGLQVQLVAAEPLIRQPVTMTFDTQGRLWVIQYLQYPTPAGLTAVEVDQYLRTKYDRVPEPPPRGPVGQDRVTILYDQDEQGRYRKAKDFVTGLNLASGLALGQGGVYVLQAPYLLFYPDRNRDDIPDGNPEVLLGGFGMEDAHAVGNSLVWGPDGWLYGAQGSTVTARIVDPLTKKSFEFQQAIWRYHPRTRQFEVFAEGGGNTWGLDFDQNGQVIAGTNWGGFAALHMVQGGNYVKGFAKHGPLHHPHSYGYFEHIPCESFRGGHVTCGGIVYQGKLLPEQFQNRYLACNLLDNNLYQYQIQRLGSSFRMKHEGTLLQGNDPWFRPIDLLTGPEGAVYVCDWYDKRANHVDPVDNWDKSNGRIYRLVPRQYQQKGTPYDLEKLSNQQLLEYLSHPNSWQRGEARRILGERSSVETQRLLRESIERNTTNLPIDLLWACYCCGGLDGQLTARLLHHPDEAVRAWCVRFIGDHPQEMRTWESCITQFPALARKEPSAAVHSQLACTIRRMIANHFAHAVCLATLNELLHRDEDADDPHVPLLLWWAMEEYVSQAQGAVELSKLFVNEHTPGPGKIIREGILERLSRRLVSLGNGAGTHALTQLLEFCSQQPEKSALVRSILNGMDKALAGQRLIGMPSELSKALEAITESDKSNAVEVLMVKVRYGDAIAYQNGLSAVQSELPEAVRQKVLEALIQGNPSPSAEVLLGLFRSARTDSFRQAILEALASRIDNQASTELLKQYALSSTSIRRSIIDLLIAKQVTVKTVADAITAGKVLPKEVSLDQVQRMAKYNDPVLNELIKRHWGNVTPQTSGEKKARIHSVLHMLGQGKGNADSGKLHYTRLCATCHTLFGEGGKVGPELTGADRGNLEFLATHIVDPSYVIRPEFTSHTVVTTDGRTLSGLIEEQGSNALTLVDVQANRITIARSKIEEISPSRTSLMPEKLLDSLDEQQIRDLFAYLQKPATGPRQPPFKSELLIAPAKFDFADKMVRGIDQFLDEEIQTAARNRSERWKKGYSSPQTYSKLADETREQFRLALGMVDARPDSPMLEYLSGPNRSSVVGGAKGYKVHAVKWKAFGNVEASGLLLEPEGGAKADVVAISDADQSPEQLSGLSPGLSGEMQYARRLAEQGFRVLVPLLIDRIDTYSGVPGIRMTNQPHREWIYRQSFEMGRHLIGYEVQKVLAAVDWFTDQKRTRPIGLIGYGEGGLIAFFCGALDTRVAVTCVDGYFGKREAVWREPIYRNIWKQLKLAGDAEIASLYPPRKLMINTMQPPQVTGPPAAQGGRAGAAPGKIETIDYEPEWKKLEPVTKLFPESLFIQRDPRSSVEIASFVQHLTGASSLVEGSPSIAVQEPLIDSAQRMRQQIDQLAEHTQMLFRQSQAYREKNFWAKLDRSSLDKYQESMKLLRQQLETEVIGKIDRPFSPIKARARLIYEQPGYTAYEVELDVFAPHIIAYGWLLVPKNMKHEERRPVVVCQHGLEGRPSDVADHQFDSPYYHQFGCKLAERGFVVFAPQNPYLFGDRFRLLQRKANPLGLSLFSFIVAQHRQITEWLAGLPFVDPERIGFYGLSYGGKTAMRVPAMAPRYCLSICSADFNEWIWKNVSIDNRYTYMTTNEWEMVEWNLGHTFNYAEMAALIAPRPFMVERGHRDGVAPDEQVAYEYAKVRRLYADLKIPGRTAIEFFDGPHTIHGVGTFQFLHQHLKWPMP